MASKHEGAAAEVNTEMPCITSARDITILYPVGITTIVTIATYLPSYVKKDRKLR